MDNKSWVTGLIVVLVIAIITVSVVMWNNKKQVDEADDYERRALESIKAEQPTETQNVPVAPAPAAPR